MISILLHPLLLSALAAAAPISSLTSRAGPSGYVLSPQGGYVGPPGEPLYFEYQPAFIRTSSVATAYVNLDVYNIDTDQTTPLARGLTAPHGDYSAFQVIQATFSFALSPIGGSNLQMVVTEYQVGDNPPPGFQSAAPSFSLEDPDTGLPPSSLIPADPRGTVVSPTNGTTIPYNNAFTVLYSPGNNTGSGIISVDVDFQDASADPGDESSYSILAHNLSQGMGLGITYTIVADFKASFGCGQQRLRFTEYSETSQKEGTPPVYVAFQYVDMTITGC